MALDFYVLLRFYLPGIDQVTVYQPGPTHLALETGLTPLTQQTRGSTLTLQLFIIEDLTMSEMCDSAKQQHYCKYKLKQLEADIAKT